MKKLIVILMMALPMMASAEKLGYINSQELFSQMPELKDAEAKLDSLQTYYENVIATMTEEAQRKYTDYQQKQATMTEAMRQISEEELMTIQQRIQTTRETAQQDIQNKWKELITPINEKMANAIQKVGAAEGYTFIFDTQATLYKGKDAVDVMPAVKKELGIK